MAHMKELEKRILNAKTALTNYSDETIKSELTLLGYDGEKISQGKVLIEEVDRRVALQIKEYGDQYQATAMMNEFRQAAEKKYSRTLKLARIVFADNHAATTALGLKGIRKRSLSGWLKQATMFYTNMTPELQQQMVRFSYTPELFAEEKALIESVANASADQRKEMGEAQEATVSRDKAIDNFVLWMSEFYQIAEIALEPHPQLKEKLGMLDRS
jgi:hypothetical protein